MKFEYGDMVVVSPSRVRDDGLIRPLAQGTVLAWPKRDKDFVAVRWGGGRITMYRKTALVKVS